MSPSRARAVVGAVHGADDGLLLPRQPGVVRRFWAEHPRITDALIVLSALALSVPAAVIRSSFSTEPTAMQVSFAIALAVVACAALLLRRTRPLMVFVATATPLLVLPPSLVPTFHVLPAFALYALAVYRSTKAAWIALVVGVLAVAGHTVVTTVPRPPETAAIVTSAVFAAVTLIIGTLIGTNVGNRRRYLEALVDRSRQLLVERDQQAQIAAAAERTRIAREMHDIVSHSLTVIVALTEGAVATSDPERARVASRSAAETARAAMSEMRGMLGVLRDASADATPLTPLTPNDPVEIVDAARRAGFPITATFSGSTADAPPAVRFALGRIVQEAVTNAMRHAPRASDIAIAVSRHENHLDIAVVNDGVATRHPPTSGGFGLRGLAERVENLGGTLTAGLVTPDRWRVHAALPLDRPPTGEEGS